MSTPEGIEAAFQRAAQLIQAGRQSEARASIQRILDYTGQLIARGDGQRARPYVLHVLKTLGSRSGTAWLQMADLVDEPVRKREALSRVRPDDPAYPTAQKALKTLDTQQATLPDPFDPSLDQPVGSTIAPADSPSIHSSANPQRRRGAIPAGVVALLIVAGVVLVVLRKATETANTPDQVVQRFFNAARAGDSAAFNALVTDQYRMLETLMYPAPAKEFARQWVGLSSGKVLDTPASPNADNASVIFQLHGQVNGKDGDFCERYDLLKVTPGYSFHFTWW